MAGIQDYEVTIGIECHVQLKTTTKLFSGANNDAREAAPNTTVSPICFGFPGVLPVLNKEAVALAMRAGVALNAEIAHFSSFDRKHYFYPDLPKGYQTTQLERPIVGKGHVDVPLNGETFRVGITRAHMEEDAGKLTHPDGADYSLVDLNRAGTPLIEIVTDPDIHSPEQAKVFAQELFLLMKNAGVTYGDLYHGNMRFDVNISVAKKGAEEWGTRAEVKNLNSFRSIERAAEYEFKRQVELLEKGEKVVQETRGWDDAKQRTFSQRSKSDAHDYRYFPDADIPPIVLSEEEIAAVHTEVAPLLPGVRRTQLAEAGIRAEIIETMLLADAMDDRGFVDLVLDVHAGHGHKVATFTANYLVNRAMATEGETNIPTAQQFGDTVAMVDANELSSNNADELLLQLAGTTQVARELAEKQGLLQENDLGAIEKVIDAVLADPASAKAVEDIKAGEMKAIGYLVGQVMKQSQGKANPGIANQLIQKRIKEG